jgi:hypothetical protein
MVTFNLNTYNLKTTFKTYSYQQTFVLMLALDLLMNSLDLSVIIITLFHFWYIFSLLIHIFALPLNTCPMEHYHAVAQNHHAVQSLYDQIIIRLATHY